jgi:hypothetical protein
LEVGASLMTAMEDFDDAILDLPFRNFLPRLRDWIERSDWEYQAASLPMFAFVRAIKSHPDTPADPLAALTLVLKTIGSFDVPAGEYIVPLGSEDGQVTFASTWEKVRFRIGDDPVEIAWEAAQAQRFGPPSARAGRYALFINVAACLQVLRRGQTILLPVHVLKKRFRSQPNTISSWIRWAKDDQVLVLENEHVFSSGGRGRAAEYYFALHRWPTVAPKVAAQLGVRFDKADLDFLQQKFAEAASPPSPRADQQQG